MGNHTAKSIVHLSNGKRVHCDNTVEELVKDLTDNGCTTLILSKQEGKELFVTKHQVVHQVPYD